MMSYFSNCVELVFFLFPRISLSEILLRRCPHGEWFQSFPGCVHSVLCMPHGVFSHSYVVGQLGDFLFFFFLLKICNKILWPETSLLSLSPLQDARSCPPSHILRGQPCLSPNSSPLLIGHSPCLYLKFSLELLSFACDRSDLLLNKQAFEAHPLVTFWKPEAATGQFLKSRQFPAGRRCRSLALFLPRLLVIAWLSIESEPKMLPSAPATL